MRVLSRTVEGDVFVFGEFVGEIYYVDRVGMQAGGYEWWCIECDKRGGPTYKGPSARCMRRLQKAKVDFWIHLTGGGCLTHEWLMTQRWGKGRRRRLARLTI